MNIEDYNIQKTPPSKKLLIIIIELCGCNDMLMKPVEEWPVNLDFNLALLNRQAELLPDDQINQFVDGEDIETAVMAIDLQIELLDMFLNSVFDGYLHDKIVYC